MTADLQDPYTLNVVLDKSGQAKGSLYIDDGRSQAHRNGKFSKIEFKFEGNKLTSKVNHLALAYTSCLHKSLTSCSPPNLTFNFGNVSICEEWNEQMLSDLRM